MKKIITLLSILLLVFGLAACGGKAEQPGDSPDDSQQINTENPEEESSDQPDDSHETLGMFRKNATLEETVLVDEEGVKITATGLNYTNYSVELELIIENNSGRDLSFISGSLGYSCNSVNGYMVNDGYLNCEVINGKKANESISFGYDGLMLYGIDEIADMEIGFDVSDGDFNHTYFTPRQVKTSAFDAHDYSKDCYQETIASPAAMNTYDYDVTCFSQDALYEVNGVKLLSSGVIINRDGESALLLELENTTSDMVYVTASDLALNGLVVESAVCASSAIIPGRRAILDIKLSSVLDPEYWSVYGIQEIGSISLSLSQYNPDGNETAEKASVEVLVPGVKAEYDGAGSEVYNKNGLRIVAKTILEASSEYSSGMHVLLFAENKSGKTLSIEDVYGSLSVNGFMADYSYDRKELADGTCAVLEIEILGSTVSASDVEEVEISFEIKEGRNTIDEPVVRILFD